MLRHEPHPEGTLVTTRTIEAHDGERLHVVDHTPDTGADPGLPTVVLAHGWTMDHSTWDRVIAALQQRVPVRVISYDQPGHGRSSMSNRRATVRGLAETLSTVIAELVPDGPIVLGGHSMGGMTVMAYAGVHPAALHDRTKGVLLVATTPELASLRKKIRGEGVLMGIQSRLPFGAPALPMPERMVRPVFGRGAPLADIDEARRIINSTSARATGQYFKALLGHDELASLSNLVGIPTIVMAGERDPLTPARWSRMYHERIRGAELDVVEDAGHMLMWEATDRVAGHLHRLVTGGPVEQVS